MQVGDTGHSRMPDSHAILACGDWQNQTITHPNRLSVHPAFASWRDGLVAWDNRSSTRRRQLDDE